MVGEWETVPLEQLVAPGRGISYGIVQPGVSTDDGVPIVRVNDVRNGRISTESPMRVTRQVEAAYSRTRLQGGELLLTLVGTIGETAIVPTSLRGWNTARAVGVIPVHDEIGAYWVQLALRSPEVRQMIASRLNTTVQATLNLGDVAQLPIVLPPRPQREKIAHILGTLDDKIELNHRMNEALEAMARALFKSWFVDFDPVRAKAEGRDTGLPRDLADLFPDSFEDSELGEIPKGWKVQSIYQMADVVYGAPFASSQFNTDGLGAPLIRIRDLADQNPGVWTAEEHPKGYKVKSGDILVGMDGEFRAYLWAGLGAWLNQRVCAFVPKSPYSAAFVRNSILAPLAHIESTETATTVIHLGKSDIDRFVAVTPSDGILAKFNASCQVWYDRIVASQHESRTLAALRDTLLPKLVSGELRVRSSHLADVTIAVS